MVSSAGKNVTVELGDVDHRLLPGMKASVQIDAGKAEGVVLVPVAAGAEASRLKREVWAASGW